MNEVTRIATVMITTITDSDGIISKEESAEKLKKAIEEHIKADNIHIVSMQDFVMEKEEKFFCTAAREEYFRENFYDILGSEVVEKLIRNGFCSAPASANHHGNHEGGLFDHSIAVARALQRYTRKLNLHWKNERSPLLVGILHDLCKIDSYKKVVTKPASFDFEVFSEDPEEYHYEYNNEAIIQGHGDKSVIYALQLGIELTEEEIACISYHMGAYETDRWSAYDKSIKKYPNVLFTHTADMEASKIVGV